MDESYFDLMGQADRELEIRCNEFAAELLVPSEEFKKDIPNFRAVGQELIPEIARKYSVSKEVILRRLLDHELVTPETYDTLSKQWNKEYLRAKTEISRGNYYRTRLAYLGEGCGGQGEQRGLRCNPRIAETGRREDSNRLR